MKIWRLWRRLGLKILYRQTGILGTDCKTSVKLSWNNYADHQNQPFLLKFSFDVQAKTIETPAYTELTEDDLRERLALLEACRKKDQLKKEPPSPGQLATVYESSSEDTSDEKYNRLHSVEEAKERAYESKLSRKWCSWKKDFTNVLLFGIGTYSAWLLTQYWHLLSTWHTLSIGKPSMPRWLHNIMKDLLTPGVRTFIHAYQESQTSNGQNQSALLLACVTTWWWSLNCIKSFCKVASCLWLRNIHFITI